MIKMYFNKKCQISVFETMYSFLIVILMFSFYFYNSTKNINDKQYKYNIDSMLNSIYYSENFRSQILNENISEEALSQDWSLLNNTLKKAYSSYEFVIKNSTVSKKIFECDPTYSKIYSSKIIAIENNDNFKFREIILGVCY